MPSIQNVVEIPSLTKLMVFVACAASIMRTGVQAVCCAAISHAFQSPFDYCGGTRYYTEEGKFCCGVGSCNIFCCNCIGGCVKTEKFSGSYSGWPGFLFKRRYD
nr:PREDICTED: uncharacterized protein LOC109035692 [Bemisia tabaci]